MNAYLPLLVVPILCAPFQLLYAKCGRRFDLGTIGYLSTGAFAAAAWSGTEGGAEIATNLALLSAAMFIVRVAVLAHGTPGDFTLIAIAQLWATPAFVEYQISQVTTSAGLSLSLDFFTPAAVATVAGAYAALVGWGLGRTSVPPRLIALTDSPRLYQALMGSPLPLALALEAGSLVTGSLAGVALALVSYDLSAEMFRAEAIWATLTVALASRSSLALACISAIAVVALRLASNAFIPSRYAAIAMYLVLALALMLSLLASQRVHREVHA